MPAARNATGWTRLCRPARYAVVLGLLYLYVFLVLDPRLLLHCQSPAFFARWTELRDSLRWPGGVLEYLAAGLSQTYASPWLGALVITLAVGLCCVFTQFLLDTVNRSRPARLLQWLPAVFLLPLLSHYTFPLSAVLSLCAALGLACVYARLPRKRGGIRVLVALILCGALYVCGGAVCLLFACLCGLIDLLTRRSWVAGILVLLLGPAIAYLLGTHVYRLGVEDAFLRLTALDHDFSRPIFSTALYISVVFGLLLARVGPGSLFHRQTVRSRSAAPADSGSDGESRLGWLARTACVVLAMSATAFLLLDIPRKAVLAVDYHARARQWDQTLAAAGALRWSGAVPGPRLDERLATTCFGFHFPVEARMPAPLLPSFNVAVHDINLALAETGQLLDRMFEYPQRMGASVVRLLPDDMGAYVAHSYNPDILLELGDVNEAERVTCECMANVGPRPWLLERLIWVNVLKGRPQAARTCLNVLAGDPRYRVWADTVRRELDKDPALSQFKYIQQIRSRMFRTDRTARVPNMDPDEEMLRYLLVANPHNRLAYDYLTAHYLLTLRADQAAGNLRHLREFGYTRIPRHCEEAILLDMRLSGKSPDLRGLKIGPETLKRFEAFQQDLDALGGPGGPDNIKARDALVGRYGDTYWFYALYGHTFFRSERPMATTRPGEGS